MLKWVLAIALVVVLVIVIGRGGYTLTDLSKKAKSIVSNTFGTTMQDLTRKAEKVKTKDQLETALGKPDKFVKVKMGISFESWTYTATDGEVNFTVIGDKVQGIVTIPKPKESKEKKE